MKRCSPHRRNSTTDLFAFMSTYFTKPATFFCVNPSGDSRIFLNEIRAKVLAFLDRKSGRTSRFWPFLARVFRSSIVMHMKIVQRCEPNLPEPVQNPGLFHQIWAFGPGGLFSTKNAKNPGRLNIYK